MTRMTDAQTATRVAPAAFGIGSQTVSRTGSPAKHQAGESPRTMKLVDG